MSEHLDMPYRLRVLSEEPPKTILLRPDRTAALAVVHVRASTSAPSRLKVALGVPISDEEGAPLAALSPEFRLEMN